MAKTLIPAAVVYLSTILLIFAGCTEVEQPGPGNVEKTSPGEAQSKALDGKTLIEARCTRCHGTGKIYGHAKANRKHWEEIVDSMIKKGASLNDAERETVVNYLADRQK